MLLTQLALKSGKELAPIPMRQRGSNADLSTQTNEKLIRKVLAADRFVIHRLDFKSDTIEIDLTNTKFRAISKAVGISVRYKDSQQIK